MFSSLPTEEFPTIMNWHSNLRMCFNDNTRKKLVQYKSCINFKPSSKVGFKTTEENELCLVHAVHVVGLALWVCSRQLRESNRHYKCMLNLLVFENYQNQPTCLIGNVVKRVMTCNDKECDLDSRTSAFSHQPELELEETRYNLIVERLAVDEFIGAIVVVVDVDVD